MRRWGGPPPGGWEGPPPPQRGAEVFIGKLPRDLNEDELLPALQIVHTSAYPAPEWEARRRSGRRGGCTRCG